ncbi:MAG: VOC family protein [Deltaproteobacteria bacterium]|nr:VOC family protein [Deltaproteobacteria bacterium]
MTGAFCWYDLSTTDTAAAASFYSTLLGWTAAPHRVGDESYTMWQQGETGFGGLMKLPPQAAAMGAPPHWMGYVWVDDAEAAVARAVALGARVYVPATTISPDVGRFAVLADPQGATFAVYQSARPSDGSDWKCPVAWHECYTTDVEGAIAFYSGLFGWEKTDSMEMAGGAGVYQMFGKGGKTFGGMMLKPAEMPMPAWLYYFSVPSADEVATRAKALGAHVILGPMDVPGGGRIAVALDPQGASFAVYSHPG